MSGRFDPTDDPLKKSRIRQAFLSTRPDLTALVDHPDSELLRVRIESPLLLDGPGNAHFVQVGT